MNYKELLEDKELSLTARAIYIYIKDVGINNISKKGLAEALNIDRSTIIRIYKELIEAGYIRESRTSINQSSRIEFLK